MTKTLLAAALLGLSFNANAVLSEEAKAQCHAFRAPAEAAMRLAQDRVSYSEGAEHLQKAFPPRSMKNDELMYEASFLPLGKTEAEKLKAIKDFGDKFVKDCLDH